MAVSGVKRLGPFDEIKLGRGGIVDFYPLWHREGRQMMLVTAVVEDVTDRPAPNQEGIRQELPMAAPRHGLGAHQSAPFAVEQRLHFFHDFCEFRREHEIGIGAKRADFPGRVLGIG